MRANVVIDESGGNRPGSENDFVAAGVVFRHDDTVRVRDASLRIGNAVGKKDYKYKHVAGNADARSIFLSFVNSTDTRTLAFGFYIAAGGLHREKEREAAARDKYEAGGARCLKHEERSVEPDMSGYLIDTYVEYFMPMLGHLSARSNIGFDVYWDDRTDFVRVQRTWNEQQARLAALHYRNDAVLRGSATGEFVSASRIAGVVAGDLRTFFRAHGERIWRHLDLSGLTSESDPLRAPLDPDMGHCRIVADIRDRLADADYLRAGSHPLLQGYSKHILSDLISFCSPDGILGHVKILNGHHWQVFQQPD